MGKDSAGRVLVHTFGPGGKAGEEWEEALCIPLAFPNLKMYASLFAALAALPDPSSRFGASLGLGPGVAELKDLGWSQDAALAEYVAEVSTRRAAVNDGYGTVTVPPSPHRPWATVAYSLDGFNSLQFVVDGFNACCRGVKLTPNVLYHPAATAYMLLL